MTVGHYLYESLYLVSISYPHTTVHGKCVRPLYNMTKFQTNFYGHMLTYYYHTGMFNYIYAKNIH